jgi:hypothetical protein
VPPGDGAAIAAAWRGARLFETAGLGHSRLLRNPRVVAEVAAFMAEDVARCSCGALAMARGRCETCLVEHELFDRDARHAAAAGA